MRRTCILIVIGLILTINLEAKKIEGRIIFKNDTIDVILNIPIKFFTQEPNYEKLQYKVKYIDSTGKKITLIPDNVKEVQFRYDFQDIRMLSRFNSLGSRSIFSSSANILLKLEIDGKLKLFSYYYTQSSPGMHNPSTGTMTGGYSSSVEKYVLQKGGDDIKRPKGITFRKDMAEYFKDCPALVKKIEGKDFRKDDLVSIVRFYNSNCR
jgi:xanthine/uracil/vitamin C permease (AzgA family)